MITKENRSSLNYMAKRLLVDIIKEIYKNESSRFDKEGISKLEKSQLIDKILELSEIVASVNEKISRRVFLPKNIELPFFTYGIFKPKQIAFSVIGEFVNSYVVKSIDNYYQFLRDGLSFISYKEGSSVQDGYKINFKPDKAKDAYFNVSNKEPRNLYKWIEIDNMNALVAVNEIGLDKHFHGDPDKIIGWNDPYFHIGLEVINSQEFDEKKMNYDVNSNWDERGFFAEMINIQMKFLLAYSMLERLAFLMTSFQSGSNQVSSVLSENDCIRSAINKVYKELSEDQKSKKREVFSSERTISSKGKTQTEKVNFTFKECIEREDYRKIIKFYYQIRNNITHRGKSLGRLSDDLKQYLTELTTIIKYTIEIGKHLK